MIWGIISLILLLIIIGLSIWLLVRSGNTCPKKKQLNESCTTTNDCNSGLICSSSVFGITGATGSVSVCKVAFGGVCSINSECAPGQVCNNGRCDIRLGNLNEICPCAVGYTCINNLCKAINNRPCRVNGDCASGICSNGVCSSTSAPTGPTGCPSNCFTSCYTDCSSSNSDHSRHTDCSSSNSNHSDYTECSSPSKSKCSPKRRHSSSSILRISDSDKFYTCSETDCSKTKYSLDSKSSYNKYSDSYKTKYSLSSSDLDCSSESDSDCSSKKKFRSSSDCYSKKNSCDRKKNRHEDTDCESYDHRYIKRGVYATTSNRVDSNPFTSVEKPITDIAQYGNGFLLLLGDGSLATSSGSNITYLSTNKKMFRIVRFGTEIVGLNKKGKLYSRNASNSTSTSWCWELLSNFPKDVVFINSTNSYSNLEVLTCSDKALVYTFSSTWKNGIFTSKRRQKDFRYYGKDLNRYMDIDERTNIGRTNDGFKYKCIKAAGFFNSGELVSVLVTDTFTHVRIINNVAYYLFEQHC